MKTEDLRARDTAALENELNTLYREQFNLRMQQAVGQLKQNHLIALVRKQIARIKTVLTEKQGETS